MADKQQKTPVKRASATRKSQDVFGHPGKQPKTALRAGLYARVSTNDQQTLPMQPGAPGEPAFGSLGWSFALFASMPRAAAGRSRYR